MSLKKLSVSASTLEENIKLINNQKIDSYDLDSVDFLRICSGNVIQYSIERFSDVSLIDALNVLRNDVMLTNVVNSMIPHVREMPVIIKKERSKQLISAVKNFVMNIRSAMFIADCKLHINDEDFSLMTTVIGNTTVWDAIESVMIDEKMYGSEFKNMRGLNSWISHEKFPQNKEHYFDFLNKDFEKDFVYAIKCIAMIESSVNHNIKTGQAGEIGIMQITPSAGIDACKHYGEKYDPVKSKADIEYNILVGAREFNNCLKAFKGNYALAAIAYNAGISRVNGWIKRYPKISCLYDKKCLLNPLESWEIVFFLERLPYIGVSKYAKKFVSLFNYNRSI